MKQSFMRSKRIGQLRRRARIALLSSVLILAMRGVPCLAAAFINGGFETGDFTGWTPPTGIFMVGTGQANSIGTPPVEGTYQALLVNGSVPGLISGSSVSRETLESYLSLPTGGLNSFSDFITTSPNFTVIEGSAVRQSFMTTAGDINSFVNFSFNFLTDEDPGDPFNDFGFISVRVAGFSVFRSCRQTRFDSSGS
jgi:hypothetical protein